MKALINVLVVIILHIVCGCQSGDGQTDRETTIHEYVAKLESKDPAMRREAIARLNSYGVHAKVAAPALVKILKDDGDAVERFRVAEALVRIGPRKKGLCRPLSPHSKTMKL